MLLDRTTRNDREAWENALGAADRHGLQMVRCDREYRAELDVGRMAGADQPGAAQRTDQVTGRRVRLIRDREASTGDPLARGTSLPSKVVPSRAAPAVGNGQRIQEVETYVQ